MPDTSGTHLQQALLHGLYNLLRADGQRERFALDVDHAIGEKQVRPDAFTLIHKQVNYTIIDHAGEQSPHLTQLVIGEDQLITAQLGQYGVELVLLEHLGW